MMCRPMWPFLFMYDSHDMRYTGFSQVNSSQRDPREMRRHTYPFFYLFQLNPKSGLQTILTKSSKPTSKFSKALKNFCCLDLGFSHYLRLHFSSMHASFRHFSEVGFHTYCDINLFNCISVNFSIFGNVLYPFSSICVYHKCAYLFGLFSVFTCCLSPLSLLCMWVVSLIFRLESHLGVVSH